MIAKLLIANRGEIACRIIRTARRMGIATVAVYSDADRNALHVSQADEAVHIGPSPAAESYLRTDAILDAAKRTGTDAIHPGYGFLSENAGFAEACAAARLVFVGPPAAAIHAMGDKANAKALMRRAGVPVVPGYDGEEQSPERLHEEAYRIGFPLLVKAVAGGGGRGMRRVDTKEDLAAAIDSARREADSAFGDGRLMLERLVENARHIEVQVFGDRHGNIVHLGERDCSTQRRHQKIIEEAPSPFADAALRSAMGDAAVSAARTVGYVGAGTVEFIVGQDRSFFFLEMNTRLQVEHPVTEMVTGLDLVEWQLRVARGETLPLRQDEVHLAGHAIEARLCAEDPAAGFSPQVGRVLHWKPEAVSVAGVRVDHGVREGGAVTPFYDPMIAKVIAHGKTRGEALAKLRHALLSLPLLGVVTNRAFLLDLIDGDAFARGEMTTGMVDAAVFAAALPANADFARAAAVLARAGDGDWFSTTGRTRCPITLSAGGARKTCNVLFERSHWIGVEVDDEFHPAGTLGVDSLATATQDRALWLARAGETFCFEEADPLAPKEKPEGGGIVISPVAGVLRHLAVREGEVVERGTLIAIVEAMKMETQLVAGIAGIVRVMARRTGDQLRAGDVVAEIAVEEPAEG